MTDVETRLAAVEARQRAYRMHDPGCPAFVPLESLTGGMFLPSMADLCECWLAEPGSLCLGCRHPLVLHVEGRCFRGAQSLRGGDYRLACGCEGP